MKRNWLGGRLWFCFFVLLAFPHSFMFERYTTAPAHDDHQLFSPKKTVVTTSLALHFYCC